MEGDALPAYLKTVWEAMKDSIMDEVRRAMRIDYFNDAELIRQQSEMFKEK